VPITPRVTFGTDGIRGRAGAFPLDPETAARLGRVVGAGGVQVVVARDTRESGPALAASVALGVAEAGGRAVDAGVLPTPGLSVLLARGWGALGVMVTASHNPPADNGLKVLGSDGGKLPDDVQAAVEEALAADRTDRPAPSGRGAASDRADEAFAAYLDALASHLPAGRWLEGRLLVADAAHGAAYRTLPQALARVGATVVPLACAPDGARINVGVGALHPAAAAALVRGTGADAGIVLDGDGDRAILVSATGHVLDGDALLYLLAAPPAVVGTVMTNAGVEEALARRGIALHRTPVGDRYVEACRARLGLAVGAEPSGHVCLADGLPTADGTLSALRVLAGGLDLDARLADCTPHPCCQRDVRVRDRRPLEDVPGLVQARASVLEALGPGGRLVLRYSGTEPVIRLLVEGPLSIRVEASAQALARFLQEALGSDP
jgi:phosphoglucosamine mutase